MNLNLSKFMWYWQYGCLKTSLCFSGNSLLYTLYLHTSSIRGTILYFAVYLVYSINTWSHTVGFEFRFVAHPLTVNRLSYIFYIKDPVCFNQGVSTFKWNFIYVYDNASKTIFEHRRICNIRVSVLQIFVHILCNH
jgi:hypothetical protein